MNLKIISAFTVLVLLLGMPSFASNHALALEQVGQSSVLTKDLRQIMEDYKKTVNKARADLLVAVQKANADAKDAMKKGLPIDQINTATKTSIEKAKAEMKHTISKAKADTVKSLLQIKSVLAKKKPSSTIH